MTPKRRRRYETATLTRAPVVLERATDITNRVVGCGLELFVY